MGLLLVPVAINQLRGGRKALLELFRKHFTLKRTSGGLERLRCNDCRPVEPEPDYTGGGKVAEFAPYLRL
jgi:hypothetical protein